MILRHATHRQNLDSIQSLGLRTAFAQGSLKAVWLHSPGQSAWAVLHCARRHSWPPDELVIIRVRVPRAWLKRTGTRGLWYVPGDIPPGCVLGFLDAAEVTASPIPA